MESWRHVTSMHATSARRMANVYGQVWAFPTVRCKAGLHYLHSLPVLLSHVRVGLARSCKRCSVRCTRPYAWGLNQDNSTSYGVLRGACAQMACADAPATCNNNAVPRYWKQKAYNRWLLWRWPEVALEQFPSGYR